MIFHLAIPVDSLENAEKFYHGILGCRVGRRDSKWIDFDFFGHQLTAHLSTETQSVPSCNTVDQHRVPARHFGVILQWEQWQKLSALLAHRAVEFYIRPAVRFAGQLGEQGTFFVRDPSGNFLEFKTFKDMSKIFATEPASL